MYLTFVFMCMADTHLTFPINLCFSCCQLYFLFDILNIKIFCRYSKRRHRYVQYHSYRDAENIIHVEVMKVIIYLFFTSFHPITEFVL
jgi:hypothetical protein